MQKILLPLAPGFEEIEAAAPIDILRRLGFEVVVAALESLEVPSAHGLTFKADCLLAQVKAQDFVAIVLPGGLPGAHHLRDSAQVIALVQEMAAANKLVAAICAAPLALDRAGVLSGRKFTCYPGAEAQIQGAHHTGARLQCDGHLLTAQGAGVAMDFGFAIGEALGKKAEVAKLRLAMVA